MKTRISDSIYSKTESKRHKHEVEFVAKQNVDWFCIDESDIS